MISLPKYTVISYYVVINHCMTRFFRDYGSLFSKDEESGNYIILKTPTKASLKRYFQGLVEEWVRKNTKRFTITDPRYYFVVNNCKPRDNILLKVKNGGYFPKKLDLILNGDYPIEFGLRERDIKIDLVMFNSIFSSIFSDYFESRKRIVKSFGENGRNVFFVQHRIFDYVAFKKIFRHMFGRKNVEKVQIDPNKEILVDINVLLNKYIRNKKSLNGDSDLKQSYFEVKDYIDNLFKEFSNGKE